MTIDGRILDTDLRFEEFCQENGIENPFSKNKERYVEELRNGRTVILVKEKSPEEKKQWIEKRDKYLRLSHEFRLWDFHFWMDREHFEFHKKYSREFADVDRYLPCDTVERQCDMTCTYFGGKCPREEKEVECPIIDGLKLEYREEDED